MQGRSEKHLGEQKIAQTLAKRDEGAKTPKAPTNPRNRARCRRDAYIDISCPPTADNTTGTFRPTTQRSNTKLHAQQVFIYLEGKARRDKAFLAPPHRNYLIPLQPMIFCSSLLRRRWTARPNPAAVIRRGTPHMIPTYVAPSWPPQITTPTAHDKHQSTPKMMNKTARPFGK